MKTAVFPGTFDPFTKGHESVVRQALPLFDRVIIAVGDNSKKNSLFTAEQRVNWIKQTFQHTSKIEVKSFKGLTVDFCKSHDAQFIIRGLRNSTDFEYERSIAHMNQAVLPDINTIFLLCDIELAAINSSIVREIYKNGGEVSQFLPAGIVLPELTK
jgi:pantetheine-phosphate adenylyltransferase